MVDTNQVSTPPHAVAGLVGLSVSFTPNGVATMHTPGPWTVDTDSDTVLGPKSNVVAQCPGYSRRSDNPLHMAQGSREDNALLIAQAPNMLDLLTESLMYVEECEEFHDKASRTLSKRIRAAIEAINPTA